MTKKLLEQCVAALESCYEGGYRDVDGDWVERFSYSKKLVQEALDAARAEVANPNSLEENVNYLLDRCRYTIPQREGGGPEDRVATLAATFIGMQRRLEEYDRR